MAVAYEDSVFLNVLSIRSTHGFSTSLPGRTTIDRVTRFVLSVTGSAHVERLFRCRVANARFDRYESFRVQLWVQAADVHLDATELTFGDYTRLVVRWLAKNPW